MGKVCYLGQATCPKSGAGGARRQTRGLLQQREHQPPLAHERAVRLAAQGRAAARGGALLAQGGHERLLAENALYKEFAQIQFAI